jgi:hypothetical protein
MKIYVHPQVSKVISFMERNVPARQLKEVARAIDQLAGLLWADVDKKEQFVAFEFSGADEVGEPPRPIANGQDH